MAISYEKLWKILADRKMKKKDLISMAKISQSSVMKMVHNGNVNAEVLVKICLALQCNIGDIAEVKLPRGQDE